MTRPLYPNALIGYRRWNLGEDGELNPMSYVRAPWQPGENAAVCSSGEHSPPGSKCGCGLYAYFAVVDARSRYLAPESVTGVIAARGDVELHGIGFRAERARPVALLRPPLWRRAARKRARLAAGRYGLPLVGSVWALKRAAGGWGEEGPHLLGRSYMLARWLQRLNSHPFEPRDLFVFAAPVWFAYLALAAAKLVGLPIELGLLGKVSAGALAAVFGVSVLIWGSRLVESVLSQKHQLAEARSE